jgi:tetratricopeptide (TPR) repeat protein
MWLYAEGFAAANTQDFDRANKDRAELAGMVARNAFADDKPKGNAHLQMAETGLSLLDGEIARLSGQLDEAITDFRKARALEQLLPYGEPPTWHEPVSHILGAALLEAGRAADAETVYRDSLTIYRADGWALFGLAEALTAEGKSDEASRVRKDFARAWSLSDVRLASSRF